MSWGESGPLHGWTQCAHCSSWPPEFLVLVHLYWQPNASNMPVAGWRQQAWLTLLLPNTSEVSWLDSSVLHALAKLFCCTAALIEVIKNHPFSLAVDGSNDTEVEKLNPLTVKIYYVNQRHVLTHLLDTCTTSRRDCGTSLAIFNKIDSVLVSLGIPWSNCVGFGVDNTSANIGLHNSLMTNCYI